ncbi:MAG: alpha-E domain-containing protein [Ethanoligenens sp.]|uniref:alpha-E domain-containing protein n=1 Tax=Ethanoligenens sp. TaxID=2099655 RepID=UPI0039EAFAFC
MGTISITQAEKLYWLGRYAERAYTLIGLLVRYYDRMLDADAGAYRDYCSKLSIPDIYRDKSDFLHRMLSETSNEASIAFALGQANSNAMLLRDRLATETVSYIQSSYNAVQRKFQSTITVAAIRDVQSLLLAFWGAVDDLILADDVRDFIKAGKYTERVDIYTRFASDSETLDAAKRRLARSLAHLDSAGVCKDLADMLANGRSVTARQIDSGILDMLQ